MLKARGTDAAELLLAVTKKNLRDNPAIKKKNYGLRWHHAGGVSGR